MKSINKNSGIKMNEEITNQKTTPEKLLCPKAGTATSSPNEKTPFQYFSALVKGKDEK